MISNITNALPIFLKNIKNNGETIDKSPFNLIESLKFYNSIFPKDNKGLVGLKHLYFDIIFKLKKEHFDVLKTFYISIDTIDFLKEFKYILDVDHGVIVMRGNMEEFGILSLILIGSIKEIQPNEANKSIFISACEKFLEYCLNNDYKVCKNVDLEVLSSYNAGFNETMFEYISILPTLDVNVGTFHFVGIDFNSYILSIFEKYKNVKFSYNKENASFIISMDSNDWDDFWENAPESLKNEMTMFENNKY